MPVTTRNEFLTLLDASARFDVSISTLRSWRRQGIITRYKRRDGTVVVDAGEVAKRIAAREEIIREDDHSESASEPASDQEQN